MLVGDHLKYTATYRMIYFTEVRKLWVGKHCIQIPVYSAEVVSKGIKGMVKKSYLAWVVFFSYEKIGCLIKSIPHNEM